MFADNRFGLKNRSPGVAAVLVAVATFLVYYLTYTIFDFLYPHAGFSISDILIGGLLYLVVTGVPLSAVLSGALGWILAGRDVALWKILLAMGMAHLFSRFLAAQLWQGGQSFSLTITAPPFALALLCSLATSAMLLRRFLPVSPSGTAPIGGARGS